MAVHQPLVSTYARNIYYYGTRNFATINAEYAPHVKKYAAETFSREEIDAALAKGYITLTEHDETIALTAAG